MKAKVALISTRPETVLDDYRRVMELADYQQHLAPSEDLILKLNLSWTKYFPACSSQPWQVEGVVKTLLEGGFTPENLFPLENKTVVTDPHKGCRNNLWRPVLDRYGLTFRALPEEEWVVREFKGLKKLHHIFPQGIEIPRLYLGKNILHLPTVKTHGHSITTGAIKNSFGGLLKEVRHYAHKYMHEVLHDLMVMQRELHPNVFAVMDGTVCGNGAGPRTMQPVVKNILLASADSVAIDAVAAKLMGFDIQSIPYLQFSDEAGLGTARIEEIEIVGEPELMGQNFGFETKKSVVIWGDQMLRKGPLRFLEKIALHSPLMGWAPFASNVYHDWLWYPTVGRRIIKRYNETPWGRLFQEYQRRGYLGEDSP
ncbi:MAG: DUF362 domain-containing protein [bacterium]